MLQFGASLTDNTRRVNYDRNTFIIQATGVLVLVLGFLLVSLTNTLKDQGLLRFI